MKFCHLHTHSDFSLLHGLAKIDDLLDAAERDGMDAIAITDLNAIYGAVDFTVKAKERGIKAIIGAEILVTPHDMHVVSGAAQDKQAFSLVLLVENTRGYKNLLRIITAAQLDGYHHKPRVDYALLQKHAEGLIALSGSHHAEVPTLIAQNDIPGAQKKAQHYQEIFGVGNFFLELQRHPHFSIQEQINAGLKKIHADTGIPLVATSDVYYIHPEDNVTHDILTCIRTNRKVDEGDRENYMDHDLSFRSQEYMQEHFADTPDALANTVKIAQRCNFEIELGNTALPHYPLPDGESADDHLTKMCQQGFVQRFGKKEMTPEQKERLTYELDIIKKTGYASYFLIVQDFVNWARSENIVVGPGRGSAAGSFVSYLIGITNMDPIEYKLLFERFLNPERVSMPDVDMDFADDRRDDVLDYCRKKYGSDHVAQIITFGTMAARAAVRDAGRALGYPYDFCDKISKLIPMFYTIEKTLTDVPDFARLFKENPDARDLITAAQKLEGLNRHSSVHACGVVITDKPVVEYTALQRVSGDEEALVTQYASSTKFSAVEKIGLLKMDFLGLKNLTIIQNTIKIVKTIHGKTIDIETIPLDDTKTFTLLQEGHTTGVFQLESSGMRRYLKQLKPTSLEDIIAMVALYRPGPMEWIPDFINGKHGTKEVTYLHPKLEKILADTYGVAVYQEQVMRIAQDLAGFTLGEADILRKAMGKKILKLIQEQKIKFIDGCVRNGIDAKIAEDIFAFIEPFAGYGFNRSHAACYALIGYQTAYLKAHYPAEFMAALMSADQGNTDRIAIEASECRDMGIDVLPPHVNESFAQFAVIYDDNDKEKKHPRIRFGLNAIKNVGHTVTHDIVKARKKGGRYRDLSDFCERVTTKDLNKRALDALAKVGAFDTFGTRAQIIGAMDDILHFIKNTHHKEQAQGTLFDTTMLSRATITLPDIPEASKKQRLCWEKELIGLYVSDHPASAYRAFLSQHCTPLRDLTQERAEQQCTIGGIVVAVSTILLKSGKNMSFVTLEDGVSSIECLIFPKLLSETAPLWQDGIAVVLTGRLSAKDGELKFLADTAREISKEDNERALRVEQTTNKYKQPIAPDTAQKEKDTPQKKDAPTPTPSKHVVHSYEITLPQTSDLTIIETIKKVLNTCKPGPTRIYLLHNGARMRTAYSITLDKKCKAQLEKILPQ